VTEILSALADRGGRTSHARFWDDMVTEIVSSLIEVAGHPMQDSGDGNTVSSS
jgi:hypothetical protein